MFKVFHNYSIAKHKSLTPNLERLVNLNGFNRISSIRRPTKSLNASKLERIQLH